MLSERTEPEEGEPWRQCEAEKPPVYTPVSVILEDGAERLGFWSGSSWIAAGAEIRPVFLAATNLTCSLFLAAELKQRKAERSTCEYNQRRPQPALLNIPAEAEQDYRGHQSRDDFDYPRPYVTLH